MSPDESTTDGSGPSHMAAPGESSTPMHPDVARARSFAIQAHQGQLYGDGQPYWVHLDAVARLVEPYGSRAQMLAYLHDTIEDTHISNGDIANDFGIYIATCTGMLSDEPGLNRQERKLRSHAKLSRIKGIFELALIVKAADRLANVRACIDQGNRRLFTMYQEEHPAFRTAAFRVGLCPDIWKELDALLSYQVHI